MTKARRRNDSVVVIGLGRFGEALALELMQGGVDVLGIDGDLQLVDALTGRLTQVVAADSTSESAMRQLSVHEFDRAVIGIGSNLEGSILTASVLLELGIPNIWAKAVSHPHARILSQLGVHHVVRPEHDTGKRVAHLVRGRMLDYIEFEDGFAMVKTTPPHKIVGRPLASTGVRREHGVTIVAIKRYGQDFTYATAETALNADDIIIVSGRTSDVENFSELT